MRNRQDAVSDITCDWPLLTSFPQNTIDIGQIKELGGSKATMLMILCKHFAVLCRGAALVADGRVVLQIGLEYSHLFSFL